MSALLALSGYGIVVDAVVAVAACLWAYYAACGQFRGWRCGWVVGVVAALTFYYLLNPITNKLDCVVVSPL